MLQNRYLQVDTFLIFYALQTNSYKAVASVKPAEGMTYQVLPTTGGGSYDVDHLRLPRLRTAEE